VASVSAALLGVRAAPGRRSRELDVVGRDIGCLGAAERDEPRSSKQEEKVGSLTACKDGPKEGCSNNQPLDECAQVTLGFHPRIDDLYGSYDVVSTATSKESIAELLGKTAEGRAHASCGICDSNVDSLLACSGIRCSRHQGGRLLRDLGSRQVDGRTRRWVLIKYPSISGFDVEHRLPIDNSLVVLLGSWYGKVWDRGAFSAISTTTTTAASSASSSITTASSSRRSIGLPESFCRLLASCDGGLILGLSAGL
jgi:hypothetical protein